MVRPSLTQDARVGGKKGPQHYRDEWQLKWTDEEPTDAGQHRPRRGYGQHLRISARWSAR